LTRHEGSTETKLGRADRYFILLELILLVLFFVSLGAMASRFFEARWLVLWVLVLGGTLVPLVLRPSPQRRASALVAACLVLIGGLALRIVVIFAAQI